MARPRGRKAAGLPGDRAEHRRSIEEGAAQFDFRRGDEPYKFDFADMTRSSAVLTLVRDSALTRLFRGAEQCRDLLQRVYRLCRRRRIRSAATAAGGAL